MSNRLWMPLNIADYLQDTGHLTAIEHGAYLLLIMEYWKKGGLPADERMISRIARMTSAEWAEHRDVLAALFLDGWKHKRVEAELARAEEITSKRRASAVQMHSKRTASAVQTDSKRDDTRASPSTKNQESASLRSAETRKRATRLPADWSLPEGWGKDAIDAGLPAEMIDLEAAKMRDWSLSSPNGAAKDWHARWRNWCREAAARLPKAREGPKRRANELSDAFGAMRQSPDDRSTETIPGVVRYLPAASG